MTRRLVALPLYAAAALAGLAVGVAIAAALTWAAARPERRQP